MGQKISSTKLIVNKDNESLNINNDYKIQNINKYLFESNYTKLENDKETIKYYEVRHNNKKNYNRYIMSYDTCNYNYFIFDKNIEELIIISPGFNSNLDNLKNNLKILLLYSNIFDNSLNKLPNSLLQLVIICKNFNKKIDKLPKNLKQLSLLSNLYNHPLDNLPQSLELLELLIYYNIPLDKNVPNSLKNIILFLDVPRCEEKLDKHLNPHINCDINDEYYSDSINKNIFNNDNNKIKIINFSGMCCSGGCVVSQNNKLKILHNQYNMLINTNKYIEYTNITASSSLDYGENIYSFNNEKDKYSFYNNNYIDLYNEFLCSNDLCSNNIVINNSNKIDKNIDHIKYNKEYITLGEHNCNSLISKLLKKNYISYYETYKTITNDVLIKNNKNIYIHSGYDKFDITKLNNNITKILVKNNYNNNKYNNYINILSYKIEYIELDNTFNEPIDNLSNKLTYIKLDDTFNKKIDNLPNTLKYLILGINFNKSTDKIYPYVMPHMNKNIMKYLEFGGRFNKVVDNLPQNIKYLIFGHDFNQKVENLPNKLLYLKFSIDFNQNLDLLPNTLKYLIIGRNFNKPLNDLPCNIIKLSIYSKKYNHTLMNLPSSIKTLIYFNNNIDLIPHSIENIGININTSFKYNNYQNLKNIIIYNFDNNSYDIDEETIYPTNYMFNNMINNDNNNLNVLYLTKLCCNDFCKTSTNNKNNIIKNINNLSISTNKNINTKFINFNNKARMYNEYLDINETNNIIINSKYFINSKIKNKK